MIFELNYEKEKEKEPEDMHNFIKLLTEAKDTIDINPKKWNNIKKIIHEYEYVYTSSNMKYNVSSIVPISRSYFKLTEIINHHKIFNISTQINCLSLAEAPGGFIQSLLNYKSQINKIYATSLLSEDKSVPYWNRKIINHKLIEFVYGTTNNGDLQDINNLLSLIGLLKNKKIYLITADGGFDYTNDYNKQERMSLSLIYGEIFMALNVQEKGGIFICKVFDLFLKETIKLIYILTLSYDKVVIHKPFTSRLSNSEKYLICKGFKGYNKEIINILFRSFKDYNIDQKIDINYEKNLMDFNREYMNQQIKQINMGVKLVEEYSTMVGPSLNQIRSSISWCNSNSVPINNSCCFLK
tara:strand:- start:667 stop:1728 length:1062 start_codon:yes stop_codon:yes gene_type:complete